MQPQTQSPTPPTPVSQTPELDELVKRIFRYVNPYQLLAWRLGLGGWLNKGPRIAGRYIVITHIGRKSGLKRQTPVNYAMIDGDIYCTAGFGKTSDWYRNLRANPNVEVWTSDGWWAGVAEDVSDAPERMIWLRTVLQHSGFAAYAAGLDAFKMDDATLRAATEHYRLVRIRRTEARTGPGGPGDLAWVWPVATYVLALLLVGSLSRRPARRGKRR